MFFVEHSELIALTLGVMSPKSTNALTGTFVTQLKYLTLILVYQAVDNNVFCF